MLVPINLTGGSYRHKSLPLSAQTTRNFWPQKQEAGNEKSPYVLESLWGKRLFADGSAYGPCRGMFEHLGILYKVNGSGLYRINISGSFTILGSIPGDGRCIFAASGSDVVIVADGKAWIWTGTSLDEITDTDLETPNSAAFLNNRIIFDGDDGRFATADVGDPTSIDGLNYATAESDADDLLRVYSFRQTLYLMGDKTVEPWWNSGEGNPPFDRVEGGIMQIGLGAIYSAANDDDLLYFLADDNHVYSVSGYDANRITSENLAREFASYAIASDAIGWCMNPGGTSFYCLTFPAQSKTFVYPRDGEWFEWSSGIAGARNNANSYAYAHRKHLVGDYRDGSVYELTFDVYTEDGDPIIRQRDSAPLHGGLFNRPGKKLTMNRFELIMQAGVGLLSGQGSDPRVMLSFSDDGGRTFSGEKFGRVGRFGEFMYKIEWFNQGTFDSRIIRLKTSDPVYYSIHSAAADIEFGI